MRSSDVSFPSASATVPLAFGLPRRERLFLATAPCVSPTFAVYGGLVTGAPSICRSVPRRSETLPGFWAVLSRAPHPHTTPSVASLARDGRPTVAFRRNDALGTRNVCIFEAGSMRLARSPAYASPLPVAGERRKAGFRVAGLCPLGRGSHPLDDGPNFRSYRIASSFRTRISWSHHPALHPRTRTTGSPPEDRQLRQQVQAGQPSYVIFTEHLAASATLVPACVMFGEDHVAETTNQQHPVLTPDFDCQAQHPGAGMKPRMKTA
jgi:hypothetical protein